MSRVLAAVAYVIAAIVGLAVVNADQNHALVLWALLVLPALSLGWLVGDRGLGMVLPWLLLPCLLLVIAIPFGDANKFTGGDDTDALTLIAFFPAVVSALLILLSAFVRSRYARPPT